MKISPSRRGRRPKFIRDRDGKEIYGLSAQPIRDEHKEVVGHRYYPRFSKPRVWLGRDLDAALMRFRAWEANRRGDAIGVKYKQRLSKIDLTLIEHWSKKLDGKSVEIGRWDYRGIPEEIVARIQLVPREPTERSPREFTIKIDTGPLNLVANIPAADLWPRIRELIISDPKQAAAKTGIRELAYLPDLKPPPPSAKLADIGALYRQDKAMTLTPKELANSKTWWDEFCEITRAKAVGDLSREAFRKYRQQVAADQGRHKRSPVYVRSRFGKVKTIINYAVHEADLSPHDLATLELRALLRPPSKPSPNPVDLTPQEIRAILKRADKWEKAMILTALNCAYYPKDICRLQWSMIDFGKRTIRFDRTKAVGRARGPVPRVAVLWPATCSALKKIHNTHAYVFVSTNGVPPHNETIRRHWQALFKKAKVKRRLTFANLRDTALTVAASSRDPVVPVQQYHVLAGHVAKGVDDNYIRRFPTFVADACEAIRRHFNL